MRSDWPRVGGVPASGRSLDADGSLLCGPIGRGCGGVPGRGRSLDASPAASLRGRGPRLSAPAYLPSRPRVAAPGSGESEGALQRAHAGLHGAHVLTCEVGALPQRLLVCGLQGQASSSGKRSAQGHAEGVGPLLREAGSFSVRFSPCRHQVAGGAGGGARRDQDTALRRGGPPKAIRNLAVQRGSKKGGQNPTQKM